MCTRRDMSADGDPDPRRRRGDRREIQELVPSGENGSEARLTARIA
jgi:hypothetical protein